MSVNINTLSPGNIVYLVEDGNLVPYVFLQYNHYGKSEVTLIRQKTPDATTTFRGGDSSTNAYNCYNASDVDNLCAALKSKLTSYVQDNLVDVSIPVARGRTATGGSVDSTIINLTRNIFLLSMTEVGLSGWQTEGSAFSYFASNALRIAYNESGNAVRWWSRSPSSDGYLAYNVDTSGAVNVYDVYNTRSFRPALTLKSGILVDAVSGGYILTNDKKLVHWHKSTDGNWYKINS